MTEKRVNENPIKIEEPVAQNAMSKEELTNKFLKFHKENPQVYKKLEEITQKQYDEGHKKLSIILIFELLRQHGMDTSDKQFLVDGKLSSFYARLLACHNEHFRTKFKYKRGKPDNNIPFEDLCMEESGCGDPIAIFWPDRLKETEEKRKAGPDEFLFEMGRPRFDY